MSKTIVAAEEFADEIPQETLLRAVIASFNKLGAGEIFWANFNDVFCLLKQKQQKKYHADEQCHVATCVMRVLWYTAGQLKCCSALSRH
ncbi:hypothetical protein AVEN_120811-1 [Araneus ventricosus]|uniref:Uncharacterized protein n=1 Tax=Araneus ventricosus TaxID=182803 RepID=A0A4Y2FDS5_ARAVE|nr:hypothetical protein AVEN_120811-1 [Araneus ventricosus]